MNEPMTKSRLIENLRAARAAWEAALARVPPDRMEEPGVAGDWSVKDLVAHINYYEGWFADRLDEIRRGEVYTPVDLDSMPFEERNERVYQKTRGLPLEQVLAESRTGYQRLLEGLQAQPEEFLVQPQTFQGSPGPVIVSEMLRGDVIDHYPEHIASIQAWLAAR